MTVVARKKDEKRKRKKKEKKRERERERERRGDIAKKVTEQKK